MKSSETLVLSAFVLLLAQGVVNAAGPAAVSPGDAQGTASVPGTPMMPGENWPLGTSSATPLGSSSTANPPTLGVTANSQTINSNAGPIPVGSQLTLKDAIAIALKYHPRLQEAADDTSAAQQQIGQARSYLGPQLFGAAEYLRSSDNGIGNTQYYNPDGAFPRVSGTNHNL